MTYSSEISMCFKKEAHEHATEMLDLKTTLEAYPANRVRISVQKIFANANKTCVDAGTGSVLYYWDALQWDTNSLAVQLIQSFLNLLEEHEFLFLKLGEKIDDTAQSGAYVDNPFGLHMMRCITFN